MKYVSQGYLEDAKKALNRGDILAVPTETVYGLAVKLDNTAAIRKLLELKNRQIGSGKILTIMIADVDEIKNYAVVNRKTMNLARHYFPGELTLILPKRRAFKHPYFDHFNTVGIRIPDHKYLLDLIRTTGPLLVTSANPRGEAPCRSSKEVAERLPKVDAIVEGVSGGNIPSTIIDWTEEEPVPVRQGGLLIVRYA
ncbi:threonylcarbamoyl-AMP synthase [Candidatus Saccharibacteria bacterium]|nr:threonylcarbamoyl-AMP synthase [Candidatus Saccharibacteria bacterium]